MAEKNSLLGLLFVGTAIVCLGRPSTSLATTIDPLFYSYQAEVSDGETVSTVSTSSTISPGAVSLSVVAPWPPPPPPVLLNSVIAGTATVNINTLPQPSIDVFASLSQVGGLDVGRADASAALFYNFQVTPVPGVQPPNVLIPIVTVGVVSGAGGLNVANVTVVDTQNTQTVFNVNQNGSFNYTMSVTSGVEYLVQMSALAEVEQTSAGASVIVDPTFEIDPNFAYASDFQILFSSGIGNSPNATPLPAALPLFATGLGTLGLFGWRRRRKNAAAIATA